MDPDKLREARESFPDTIHDAHATCRWVRQFGAGLLKAAERHHATLVDLELSRLEASTLRAAIGGPEADEVVESAIVAKEAGQVVARLKAIKDAEMGRALELIAMLLAWNGGEVRMSRQFMVGWERAGWEIETSIDPETGNLVLRARKRGEGR